MSKRAKETNQDDQLLADVPPTDFVALEAAAKEASDYTRNAAVIKALRAAIPLHLKHHDHDVVGLLKHALALTCG